MELEPDLDQLASYLGCDLKLIMPKSGRIIEMKGIKEDLNKELSVWDYEKGYFIKYLGFKPILKPITKIKRKSFVCELYEIFGGGYINIKSFKANFIESIIFSPFSSLPYDICKYLFKNHFDVFGLIKKGLAVDYYSIKK